MYTQVGSGSILNTCWKVLAPAFHSGPGPSQLCSFRLGSHTRLISVKQKTGRGRTRHYGSDPSSDPVVLELCCPLESPMRLLRFPDAQAHLRSITSEYLGMGTGHGIKLNDI